MRRFVPAIIVLAVLGQAPASAQPAGPVDLSKLPAEIKSLKWKDIDLSTLSAMEQCTSLLLLNDVLDELRARLTAEADLMSAYIDANSLGSQFAATPPIQDTAPLSLTDAQKIATALLRGPMAQSTYPTQLAGSPANQLSAYETMYQSSCQWKWASMADSRLRVRSMVHFLNAQGKLDDYQAWVPGEVQKLSQQHQAALAQQQQAAAAQSKEKQEEARRLQAQREAQLQSQEAQTEKAAVQMQQSLALAQAQNQPVNPQNNPNLNVSDDAYPADYYGWGLGAVGADAWYRDGAYAGAACARTDARMAGWHGGVRR